MRRAATGVSTKSSPERPARSTVPKDLVRLSETPCPRCLRLAIAGGIDVETVQRLPAAIGAAPLARDGSGKCCYDCASADVLMRWPGGMDFRMARIAVSNERQEHYRLPGARIGLVAMGLARPSAKGDLEDQHRWLDRFNWFGIGEDT
jgi:hypothetical protein